MSAKWVRVYVAESVRDVVQKLNLAGVKTSFRPKDSEQDDLAFLPRSSGTIYAASVSACTPPESAKAEIEIIDDHSMCGFLLRTIHEALTVVLWPEGYDVSSLPATEPEPTIGDVISASQTVQAGMQLFGCTADFQQEYSDRMKRIGQALEEELKMSPDEIMGLPPTTLIPPSAVSAFAELRTWLETMRCNV